MLRDTKLFDVLRSQLYSATHHAILHFVVIKYSLNTALTLSFCVSERVQSVIGIEDFLVLTQLDEHLLHALHGEVGDAVG
jgi:hypothetical protein